MELIYSGKTKDVYAIDPDTVLMKFKDDATGENGVFDPGCNTIGLTIEGAGLAGLRLTEFFYGIINKAGIPTHFIEADYENRAMKAKKAEVFGRGIEVICRYRAVGSFFRRYGGYVTEGQKLDAFVETTLKDDARNDPPITDDCMALLNIMSKEEYQVLKGLTRKIGEIVKKELSKKGLELYDIKFEFGRIGKDRQIALIDEISGGNMRAYKDGKPVTPLELECIMLMP